MKSHLLTVYIKLPLITMVLLYSQTSLFGQTVVCLKEQISGFETEYKWAKATLTKASASGTSEINKATIFITYKKTTEGDFMYFHSNYKPKNNSYTVKIATNESLDLDLITSNIVNVGGLQFEYEDAFRKHIKFIIDYRIFYHEKFKNLDLGNATNIVIMDAKGVIHEDGFKVYNTQKELKKMGYYKSLPDGITGKNTETAIAAFRKTHSLEGQGKIYLYTRNGRKRIIYKDPEEFLKKFETPGDNCEQPLSICIDDDSVASFVIECNGQSIELTTEGELTLTATNGNETFTHTISLKSQESTKNQECANSGTKHDDSVKFLKCYQSASAKVKGICENSIKLCLGKETGISFEVNCDGNKVSASTSGGLSITSRNGRSRSIQF